MRGPQSGERRLQRGSRQVGGERQHGGSIPGQGVPYGVEQGGPRWHEQGVDRSLSKWGRHGRKVSPGTGASGSGADT
ncbi:hypothetical protein GCM10023193_41470 [Planotetraspora kaengkrachanensis]|uniref:Uncharacterized protein n=1 Tax=Planotetraspora kaengkrachanensis TaxID=575193 RepID=A0A8J3LZ23_9ACTN|nr:hypothetical protein Pka01_36760 [Planotetraspora kaengkrachanensis]